ncbi:hypothetical protein LSAT2_003283 [Lamellibrachia satsuma]|nr:hypothetical protein LSAT2_003283 [Lamellibrachia satsuma]
MPLCSLQSLSGASAQAHAMDTNAMSGNVGYAPQSDTTTNKTSPLYDIMSDLNVTIESATNRTVHASTRMNTTVTASADVSLLQWLFGDVELVKAVVLVVVITVLLLSTGRLIFKTFSGVGVGKDDCV